MSNFKRSCWLQELGKKGGLEIQWLGDKEEMKGNRGCLMHNRSCVCVHKSKRDSSPWILYRAAGKERQCKGCVGMDVGCWMRDRTVVRHGRLCKHGGALKTKGKKKKKKNNQNVDSLAIGSSFRTTTSVQPCFYFFACL